MCVFHSDLIVTPCAQTILGEALCLPLSTFRIPYYVNVLAQLTKMAPTIPAVVGEAFTLLVERASTLDFECLDRFAEFFAHYLSNFAFNWQYDEW